MKLICFGDSNTWGYDPRDRCGDHYEPRWTDILAEQTGWNVINQGLNGREVPDAPAEVPEDADRFAVMLGTNDLLQLDTPEAAAQRMEVFLSSVPREKAVLLAPPPMVWGEWVQDEELMADSRRLAVLYRALAEKLGIRFLDTGEWGIPLSYDGVHFTQEGQYIFAQALGKELAV